MRILLAALTLSALPAMANPRALPFTYPYETLSAGGIEIEQFVEHH